MNTIHQSASDLLKSILTASQNGVSVYRALRDTNGVITDLRLTMLNAVAERDLGQPAVELLGNTFDKVYPHLAQTLGKHYKQVIETGESIRFEFEYNRPGQSTSSWCDVSAVRMEDCLVVSYSNITQHKANEDAARRASVLEQAFDSALSGITVYEAILDETGEVDDFRFLMINEAGLRMSSGFTRDELIGKTLWQIYPATGLNGLFSKYVQVYKTGKPLAGENYYPEYDLWREYSIVRIANGVMVTYNDITMYQKLEETSQQQAQLLDGVLEAIPVGLGVLNAVRSTNGRISNFHVSRFNSAFRKIFAPTVTSGHDPVLTTFIDGGAESGLLSRCIMCVEGGTSHSFEMPYRSQNSTHWYQTSMTPTGDQIILTVTDITKAKQTQLDHHFQAELLKSIGESTPAGLVLWEAVRDKSGQIIDFQYRMTNRMNSYLTGYTDDYLTGQQLFVLFPHFKGTALDTALRETIDTGRTQHMVLTNYTQRPNGWLDAQFSRVSDGRSTDAVLMTFIDISEQHEAQLTQKAQADLLQVIINAQPSGLVLFNPVREESISQLPGRIIDFTYVLVNETQKRLTRRTEQELIGARLLTLFPSDEGHDLFERLVEVAETGENKEWIMPYFSDGIEGWFQTALIRHGERVLFTFLDVSDLKRKKRGLEVANMELRRSNENLQQFAYVASHDLQEPLRKIQSFGDLLAKNYAAVLDTQALDMVNRMQQAASRMSGLIKDLLDYSRVSTQRSAHESIPLSKLIAEVADDLYVSVQQSGAIINYEHLPVCHGDKAQLRQLFQNLLANAIKFRRPDVPPVIQVSSRKVPAKQLPDSVLATIEAVEHDQTVNRRFYHEISVSDNGIGFDEKYLDRIFQVFQRLHTKSAFPGTGVGLAICRKVIENHGGALSATSQPQVGSTFFVYLPVT
jgi:signal transduction histidine kinase